jgi:hypothetical protein
MLSPNNHRASRLQERKAARDYGGRTTPGSGNQWFKKGDVSTLNQLIECKTTTKDSYTLKYADLRKIWQEAILEDKCPLFEIYFSSYDRAYVVLDKQDYLELRAMSGT